MNDIVVYRASIFSRGQLSRSLSRDTELIKSKGHHLQTPTFPKGEHLIAYAGKETSQQPKNTATPGSEVELLQ